MSDNYFSELDDFGKLLHQQFPSATNIHMVSYAGGTPGMQANLPEDAYEAAKQWLGSQFGEPVEKPRWHVSQRPKVPVLEFKATQEVEGDRVYHVNLIRMHTQHQKRFTLVSWM